MLTLNDGRSELWQWDTGRKLTVDADCSQVHFSNKVFGRSVDVDVVDGVATIPDILLQTDKELTAWAFVGTAENGYTKISKVFKVNKRNKPADYVFTPQDQTTLEEIVNRLEDLENQKPTSGFVKSVNGIKPDENGNIDVPTGTGNAVQYVTQTLTDEQKQQARKNIGASSGLISILDIDPKEPKEGQMWILKTKIVEFTTPVIELSEVRENSIAFKLSNASFDGSGAVITTYHIYVNGSLNKTENIEAGGICVVDGLSPKTEYKISVRGVNGTILSAMSNTLTKTTLEDTDIPDEPDNICVYTAGEENCVDTYGLWPRVLNGSIFLDAADAGKAAILSLAGDKPYTNRSEVQGVYYPLAVPADAVSITVECPSGTQYSYNGYTVTGGIYERTIDSGYKNPGATYTFDAGKCQYGHVYIKNTSGSFSGGEIAGTTVTFA